MIRIERLLNKNQERKLVGFFVLLRKEIKLCVIKDIEIQGGIL